MVTEGNIGYDAVKVMILRAKKIVDKYKVFDIRKLFIHWLSEALRSKTSCGERAAKPVDQRQKMFTYCRFFP